MVSGRLQKEKSTWRTRCLSIFVLFLVAFVPPASAAEAPAIEDLPICGQADARPSDPSLEWLTNTLNSITHCQPRVYTPTVPPAVTTLLADLKEEIPNLKEVQREVLETAIDSVDLALQTVEDVKENQVDPAVVDAVDTVNDLVDNALLTAERTRRDIEEVEGEAEDTVEQQVALVQEELAKLQDDIDDAIEEYPAWIQEEVWAAYDLALDTLDNRVEWATNTVEGAQETAEEYRALIEQEKDEALATLQSEVDQVVETANDLWANSYPIVHQALVDVKALLDSVVDEGGQAIEDATAYAIATAETLLLAVEGHAQEVEEVVNRTATDPTGTVEQLILSALERTDRPAVRLPSNWLDTHEVMYSQETGTLSSIDWDQDGIPDVLDPVNLPSESQLSIALVDAVTMVQGLEPGGFFLLIEPTHNSALFVTAEYPPVDPGNTHLQPIRNLVLKRITDAQLDPDFVRNLANNPEQSLLPSGPMTTGAHALNWVEQHYSIQARNEMARVIGEDMRIYRESVVPNSPLASQTLPWAVDSTPVDGSWLMVRSDATRSVELVLGGNPVLTSPPLSSHPLVGSTNVRWEFINVHRDSTFCYDEATVTTVTSCRGNQDPGWIRAYSGLAANTLARIEEALARDVIDFGPGQSNQLSSTTSDLAQELAQDDDPPSLSDVEEVIQDATTTTDASQKTTAPQPSGESSGNPSSVLLEDVTLVDQQGTAESVATTLSSDVFLATPAISLPSLGDLFPDEDEPAPNVEQEALYSSLRKAVQAFRPDTSGFEGTVWAEGSPWKPVGENSYAFEPGVGTDYLFELEGLSPGESLVRQTVSLDNASTPAELRPFHFVGRYSHIPADPEDIVSVGIGIEPIDGNHTGQVFVLDGRAIQEMIPGIQNVSRDAIVTIDEAHEFGFTYVFQDVDLDGIDDILVRVPHFSPVWIEVEAESNARFYDLEFVRSDYGWAIGDDEVYSFSYSSNGNFHMAGTTIPGLQSNNRNVALHSIDDDEFWVGGEGGCSNGAPYIAHYERGSWELFWLDGRDGNADIRTPCNPSSTSVADLWVSSSGDSGYAVISKGLGTPDYNFLKFNGNAWQAFSPSGTPDCRASEIVRNSNGDFYVGYSGCSAAVYEFDDEANSMSSVSPSGMPSGTVVLDLQDGPHEWAVGVAGNDGLLLKRASGSFSQGPRPPSDIGSVHAVEARPSSADVWFSIANYQSCNGCQTSALAKYSGTWEAQTWGTDSPTTQVWDIEFWDKGRGLASSSHGIYQYEGRNPPQITSASLSPTSVTTQQTVSGSISASDEDGDPLTYEWQWGSEAVTVGSSGSYKFNHVGTHTVRAIVKDPAQLKDERTWSVSVSPESLPLGSSDSVSMTGTGARHHYHVPSSSGKVVEAKITSGECRLISNVGSHVASTSSAQNWPQNLAGSTAYSSTNQLAGKVSGGDLYLALERTSTGSGSCGLYVGLVELPSKPAIVSAPMGTTRNTEFTVKSSVDHPSPEYGVAVEINWGDSSSTRYPGPGTTMTSGTLISATHAYASYGSKSVTLTPVDQFGQSGPAEVISIVVRDPAQVVADGATGISFYHATLTGTVTDRGGAPSADVRARYQVINDATESVIATSPTFEGVSSTVPAWTASGLDSGTIYRYRVQVDNGLGYWISSGNEPQFTTLPTTDSVATFEQTPGSVSTGESHQFTFHHSPQESGNVRYRVSWGDGSTTVSPFMPSSQHFTTGHTYDFPHGNIVIGAQIEITSGDRSETATKSISVNGDSPISSVNSVATYESATLTVTLSEASNAIIQDGNTEARLGYIDQGQEIRESNWHSVNDGIDWSWFVDDLDEARTYQAFVEFQTDDGKKWRAPTEWSFAANQPPSLELIDAKDLSISYLDRAKFVAKYQDPDGDPPSSIQVRLNGQWHDLHTRSQGTPKYEAGEAYYFEADSNTLPPPGMYTSQFRASNAYHGTPTFPGATVTVSEAAVMTLTFSGDSVGSTPSGFTKDADSMNFWQVADTEDPAFPDYATIGSHGNALWFGRPPAANYNDPAGGTPKGSIYSSEYALTTVDNPVMFFSSYYETEDLTNVKDTKRVYIRSKDVGDTNWDTTWTLIHDVKGLEGGYKKWKSQAIDLSAYEDKVVQFEFRFDAKDNQRNKFLGWLIDDISIGTDNDGDALPDELERNRGIVTLQSEVGPAIVEAGEIGYIRLPRTNPQGMERASIDYLVTAENAATATLTVGAAPTYMRDDEIEASPWSALALASIQPTDSSIEVCGTHTVVANGVSSWDAHMLPNPFIAYAGYPNQEPDLPSNYQTSIPEAETERDAGGGTRGHLDITNCLDQGRIGYVQPLGDGVERDLFLRVDNRGSAEAMIFEHFRLSTVGRTSAFTADSDSDGFTDNEEGTSAEALSPDHDHDGVPAESDQSDSYPDQLPVVQVILEDQPDSITYRLSIRTPMTLESIELERGEPIVTPNVAAGYVEWKVDFKNQARESKWIRANWEDEKGARFTVFLQRDEAFDAQYVTYARHVYENGQFRIHGSWSGDLVHTDEVVVFLTSAPLKLGAGKLVNAGTKALGWAAPARWVAKDQAKDLVDVAILAGAKDSVRLESVQNSPDVAHITRNWISPQGGVRSGLSVEHARLTESNHFDGLSANQVTTAMQNAVGPYPSMHYTYRWLSDEGDSTIALTSTQGGRILRGENLERWTPEQYVGQSNGANAEDAMASVEHLVQTEAYGETGNVEDIVCYRVCGIADHSPLPLQLDPASVNGHHLPISLYVPYNWLEAMRMTDDANSGLFGNTHLAQNAIGLWSLQEAGAIARGADTSGVNLPPQWVEYWGDPETTECTISTSSRRCMNLSMVAPATGYQPDSGNFEPIKVHWQASGTTKAVDVVATDGWYMFFHESGNGKSITQTIEDSILNEVPRPSGTVDAVVTIAVDATGPILGEDRQKYSWRNAVFSHHYEM